MGYLSFFSIFSNKNIAIYFPSKHHHHCVLFCRIRWYLLLTRIIPNILANQLPEEGTPPTVGAVELVVDAMRRLKADGASGARRTVLRRWIRRPKNCKDWNCKVMPPHNYSSWARLQKVVCFQRPRTRGQQQYWWHGPARLFRPPIVSQLYDTLRSRQPSWVFDCGVCPPPPRGVPKTPDHTPPLSGLSCPMPHHPGCVPRAQRSPALDAGGRSGVPVAHGRRPGRRGRRGPF